MNSLTHKGGVELAVGADLNAGATSLCSTFIETVAQPLEQKPLP